MMDVLIGPMYLYQGFINKITTLWKTSIYLFILAVTLNLKD